VLYGVSKYVRGMCVCVCVRVCMYIYSSRTASAAETLYAIVNECCGIRLAVLVDVTQVYDHPSPALGT
jgi:hypothetical protein